MVICYFGFYDANYSRNRILIKGLEKNGVKAMECHTVKTGLAKYWELVLKFLKIRNKFDVMVVGFPGFQSVILAKLLTRKPVIFDAFLSLYDSNVFDRKLYPTRSFKAYKDWMLDWLANRLADTVVIDTSEHINYLAEEFGIKRNKMERIFIGADDDIFYPRPDRETKDKFVVHFHGSFLPLQGTKYIIEAANILKNENIIFNLVGGGTEHGAMINKVKELGLLNSVKFLGYAKGDEVPNYIANSDICLGIFGDTEKTKRVIPNKVYECLAMKKPVITVDTPAAREVLTEDNVLFSKVADDKDLAEKILILKNDEILRKKIAQNGYELYKKTFSPMVLGKNLLEIIEKYYGKK